MFTKMAYMNGKEFTSYQFSVHSLHEKLVPTLERGNQELKYLSTDHYPLCLPRYWATPSAVGFMASSPSCQLAGQTSPCFSWNCNASSMRSASSTLRPMGRSFISA